MSRNRCWAFFCNKNGIYFLLIEANHLYSCYSFTMIRMYSQNLFSIYSFFNSRVSPSQTIDKSRKIGIVLAKRWKPISNAIKNKIGIHRIARKKNILALHHGCNKRQNRHSHKEQCANREQNLAIRKISRAHFSSFPIEHAQCAK